MEQLTQNRVRFTGRTIGIPIFKSIRIGLQAKNNTLPRPKNVALNKIRLSVWKSNIKILPWIVHVAFESVMSKTLSRNKIAEFESVVIILTKAIYIRYMIFGCDEIKTCIIAMPFWSMMNDLRLSLLIPKGLLNHYVYRLDLLPLFSRTDGKPIIG